MSIFRYRPLALGCAVFLALLRLLYYKSINAATVIFAIGAFLALLIIIFSLLSKKRLVRIGLSYLIPLALAFLACALLSVFVFGKDRDVAGKYAYTEGRYEMLVETVEYENEYQNAYLGRCDEIGQRIFIITDEERLERGQLIRADFEFIPIKEIGSAVSEKDIYTSDGIYLKAYCQNVETVSEGNSSIRIFFNGLNSKYTERIQGITNGDTSSIISALFLGNKSLLESSNRRDFARLGISHILALSGIHLSIIVSMVSGVFGSAGIGIRKRYFLTMGVIVFFICMTGFSESAIRSGVMLGILYTMFFFKKRSDFITEIFLSVTLICVFLPYSVMSVSLMLSFFAMLGCAVSGFIMRKTRLPGFLRKIVSSLVTTLTVSLMTLPVVFMNFGFISLIAPLSNLIFIPLFTALLFVSPFLLALGDVSFIGEPLRLICEGLTEFILNLSEYFASLSGIVLPLRTDADKYGVVLLFLSVALIALLRKRSILLGILILAVGVSLISYQGISLRNERMENDYARTFGDSRGDRTYIESNGKLCVIDSIYTSKGSLRQVYDYVSEMGYMEIEMYIMTDYTARSYEALDMLTDAIYVRSVAVPTPANEDEFELFLAIQSMAESKNIALYEISRKMEFEDLKIFFAPTEFLPRSTKRLVAYYIEGKTSRYTYAGASTYESRRVYNFVEKSINASDAVFFGGSGPKFKYRYEYDLTNVKYLMFATKAVYYCKCETRHSRTVLEGRIFSLG